MACVEDVAWDLSGLGLSTGIGEEEILEAKRKTCVCSSYSISPRAPAPSARSHNLRSALIPGTCCNELMVLNLQKATLMVNRKEIWCIVYRALGGDLHSSGTLVVCQVVITLTRNQTWPCPWGT